MSAHAIDGEGTVYTAVTDGYDKPAAFDAQNGVVIDHRTPPGTVPGDSWVPGLPTDTGKARAATLWNRLQKIRLPPMTGLWSLYLDGSITPKVQVKPLVEGWLELHDMALLKHPHRTCAYDEIDACVTRKKISPEEGEKARSHLMLAGFPRNFGLWACGIIARRVHSNPIQIFAAPLWWELVEKVPRDQIWLPFVLWKLKQSTKRINTIDANIFDNRWFSFRRHGT